MKIALGLYTCGRCKAGFEAPMLSDFSYGEFLLWSPNGGAAYLNALEDSAYNEASAMIATLFPKLAREHAADVLQAIFGPVVCDPDPTGAAYSMMGAACSHCGATPPASWRLISPPAMVDVPPVAHDRWSALTTAEKEATLTTSVEKHEGAR